MKNLIKYAIWKYQLKTLKQIVRTLYTEFPYEEVLDAILIAMDPDFILETTDTHHLELLYMALALTPYFHWLPENYELNQELVESLLADTTY